METSSAEMLFENFHLKNREFGHGGAVILDGNDQSRKDHTNTGKLISIFL